MGSKTATLKRRHAAKLRRIERQRKCGMVPQHTLTERHRAVSACHREREARLKRIKLVKRETAMVLAGISASVMYGLMIPAAAASTPPPPAAHNFYRDYLSGRAARMRLDRGDSPHNDRPDVTWDGFAAAYIVTGPGPYLSAGSVRCQR